MMRASLSPWSTHTYTLGTVNASSHTRFHPDIDPIMLSKVEIFVFRHLIFSRIMVSFILYSTVSIKPLRSRVRSNSLQEHFTFSSRVPRTRVRLVYLPHFKSSPRLDLLRFPDTSSLLIDESRSPNWGVRCCLKTVCTILSIEESVAQDCLGVANLSLLIWKFSCTLN